MNEVLRNIRSGADMKYPLAAYFERLDGIQIRMEALVSKRPKLQKLRPIRVMMDMQYRRAMHELEYTTWKTWNKYA